MRGTIQIAQSACTAFFAVRDAGSQIGVLHLPTLGTMRRISILTCLAVGLASTAANAAPTLRFRETAAGNVIATGNTLGLSKALDQNGPGTEDSIGTFLSLDGTSVDDFPASPVNPWGAGTTNDWTVNGSDALPLAQGIKWE